MTVPANKVYQNNDATATQGDNLNTFPQLVTSFAALRSFVAEPGMLAMVTGAASLNDGGQGFFQFQLGTVVDDNHSFLVVNAHNAPPSYWVRVNIQGTGGGTGTVTSVGLASSDFSISGSPITTTGTITANLKGILTAGTATKVTYTAKGLIASTSTTDLSKGSDVTGNLPVTNLNSGTAATSATFWCGNGTWAVPGAVTPAEVKIARLLATGSPATMTATITMPAGYTGLKIKITGGDTGAGGDLKIQFNGDTTAGHYQFTRTYAHVVYDVSTTPTIDGGGLPDNETSANMGQFPPALSGFTFGGTYVTEIPNALSRTQALQATTTYSSPSDMVGSVAGGMYVGTSGQQWSSSAAVTSVTILAPTAFADDTIFTVYATV